MELITINKNKTIAPRQDADLNGGVYDIVIENTYTETYNEELNSAVVKLSHITSPLDIDPYDRVVLRGIGNNDKYMLINSYTRTQICLNPVIYKYEITLFSEIKALEGVVLPSLRITHNLEQSRSISRYLTLYLNLYGQKHRVNGAWENKWSIAEETLELFDAIQCPEFQWNRPTLREVFNDLMIVADCIPTMNNNVISHICLTDVGSEISKTGINEVVKSKSSEDYTSEIRIEMENALNDQETNVINSIKCVERISGRNNEDYIITDQNLHIYTQNPIYRINHLYMYMPFYRSEGGGMYRSYIAKIDLCNLEDFDDLTTVSLVAEDKEYAVKPITYYQVANKWNVMAQYKNYYLHYARGGNDIYGFEVETKANWIQNFSLAEKIMEVMLEDFSRTSGVSYSTRIAPQNLQFDVEYETYANTVLQAGQLLPYDNKRVVVDNQTNSFVNINKQSLLEYAKANRLGNEVLLINARYTDISSIASLGQTYEGNVIFKKEISFNPNFINVNYYATKNYVLQNYFTGINAKIRSWKIADGSEASVRHDLQKYYYEFSFKNCSEIEVPDNIPTSRDMLSPLLNHYDFELLRNGLFYSIAENGDRLPSEYDRLYHAELNSRVAGNSLLFTIGFNDNYGVGLNAMGSSSYVNRGENNLPYVDNNGEYAKCYMIITGEIEKYDDFIVIEPWKHDGSLRGVEWADISYDDSHSLVSEIYTKGRFKPIILDHEGVIGDRYIVEFNNFKDNKEITKLTLQLELCSETTDIIFGSQFINDEKFISLNFRGGYNLFNNGEVVNTKAFNDMDDFDATLYTDKYIIFTELEVLSYISKMYKSNGSEWVEVDDYAIDKIFIYNNQTYKYIGNGILFRFPVPYEDLQRSDLKVYVDSNKINFYKADEIPNTATPIVAGGFNLITILGNKITVNLTSQPISHKSIYITDSNKKVLLKWNSEEVVSSIYLNRLIERDHKTYTANGIIDGDIEN